MPDKGSYISGELLRQTQERAAASKPAELTPRSQPAAEAGPETDGASAGDTAVTDPKPTGKKRRRRGRTTLMALGVVLGLGLLAWGSVEQLAGQNASRDAATAPGAATSTPGTATADAGSVSVAVQYQQLVVSGQVKQGCSLTVAPGSCEQAWMGTQSRRFAHEPRAIQSTTIEGSKSDPAAVTEPRSTPKATVVLVTYQYEGESQGQRWVVLVRDSDHKVIDSQSIGADEAGMSLAQVGRKIQEANS